MITERNMVFANPQAYRVFPQIGNPYNTGITDTAIYEGYLQVTDQYGTTKSFSNTNTIDFTGFQGTIDVDQYTDTGSVKLGRWDTSAYSPWVLMYFDYPLTLNNLPANGYNSGTNNTEISVGAVYVDRSTIGQTSQSGSAIPWYCFEDFSGDYGWFTISNVGTRASYGKGRCYFDIEVEPNTADETRSYDIPVSWSWTRSEDDPDTFFEGIDHMSGSGAMTITQEGGGVLDVWKMSIVMDDRFGNIPYNGITTTSSDGWWVGIVATNEYRGQAISLPTHCYSVEDLGGTMNITLDGSVSSTHDNKPVYNVLFTVGANTEETTKSAVLRIRLRMTRQDCIDILGDDRPMGYIGSVMTPNVIQQALPRIAPYTPGWSIGFSMTNQGLAARAITNGIEVLQTGANPTHDDNNFFGYTNELYEGERFYSATIQVSGLPEGYTIIGIHGWDGVTITQDGEYTLPEFTWTNPSGYLDGTSIPYQDVPSLRFADGTQADIMFDTPITIVITAVQSTEESINEHV